MTDYYNIEKKPTKEWVLFFFNSDNNKSTYETKYTNFQCHLFVRQRQLRRTTLKQFQCDNHDQ